MLELVRWLTRTRSKRDPAVSHGMCMHAADSCLDSHRAQAGLARASSGAEWVSGEPPSSPGPRMNLHVGVLHYTPFREPFPLLAEPVTYTPDTLDIWVRPYRICGFRGLRVFRV